MQFLTALFLFGITALASPQPQPTAFEADKRGDAAATHYCYTTTSTLYPPCPVAPTPTTCKIPQCIRLVTVTATCPHIPCVPVKTVTSTYSCPTPVTTCPQGCRTTTTTVPPGICPG